MSGAKSRNKGKRGELEIVHLLRDNLGIDCNRNYKQVAQAQHGDIEQLVGPFLIEIKNCADLEIPAWWRQAVAAAMQRSALPCVAYKVKGARDPFRWRFIVPLPQSSGEWSFDLQYTQTVYQDGFFLIVREHLA
jgi:hypothetical protein